MNSINVLNFQDKKSVFTCGDVHCDWKKFIKNMEEKDIKDALIIILGDFSRRTVSAEDNIKIIKEAKEKLEGRNINVVSYRGNHDNPAFFEGDTQIVVENFFEAIPDYTVIQTNVGNFLCVGGALSINRVEIMRQDGAKGVKTYWPEEVFNYDETLVEQINNEFDINFVCTHTCPSFSFPVDFHDERVKEREVEDYSLVEDILNERLELTKLYDKLSESNNVKEWYYGHFHKTQTTEYHNTMCFLRDKNELKHVE